ncbi:nuclear transport factor 2 family protein [Haliea sp. E17]|uniref:nuclear transport factor 2 family protein n=1 Tax=Haliea sp. E17 TaxID=3401576 RepID=UPI003AAF5D6A
MNIEELLARESIRQTMARYSIAGDDFDADEYITCFTADAVMEFVNFPGIGDLKLEGREAIYEFVSGWFGAVQRGETPVPGGFMRHNLTTCRIDLDGADAARSRTYCVVFNTNGAESSGVYTDQWRREGAHWLLEHRRWKPDC